MCIYIHKQKPNIQPKNKNNKDWDRESRARVQHMAGSTQATSTWWRPEFSCLHNAAIVLNISGETGWRNGTGSTWWHCPRQILNTDMDSLVTEPVVLTIVILLKFGSRTDLNTHTHSPRFATVLSSPFDVVAVHDDLHTSADPSTQTQKNFPNVATQKRQPHHTTYSMARGPALLHARLHVQLVLLGSLSLIPSNQKCTHKPSRPNIEAWDIASQEPKPRNCNYLRSR